MKSRRVSWKGYAAHTGVERLSWKRHAAHMGVDWSATKVWAGKPEGNRLLAKT
jgi:hypothetical protein